MRPHPDGELFSDQQAGTTPETIIINGRCTLRTRDGRRVVLVGGVPTTFYAVGDRAGEAHAMVQLVEQGLAEQQEVARAFGRSARTVRRAQRRFEEGGLARLARGPGYPKGLPRLRETTTRRVSELKERGLSNRAIASRMGVSEKAVRKVLKRLGWKDSAAAKQEQLPLVGADPNLSASPEAPAPIVAPIAVSVAPAPGEAALSGADPNLSGPQEPLPFTSDTDPANRVVDRAFAALGLLDDAAPLFQSGPAPHGGVLLAIPALVASGVFECAKEVYGGIGPAFYGLRSTMVTLLLMALLRIKRPEALKEHSPADLGRLIGLDRMPEVKTLRRKLSRLAAVGLATQLGRALANRHVQAHGSAVGFLYVDGHVRVYYGQRDLPKAHVTRLRTAMPATTDYWVNDTAGEPVLVLTAPANAGLVTMLPPILAEIRALLPARQVTVVFDRGGYSPKLFAKMIADGFDVLTYRKGRWRKLPRRCFHERHATIDGHEVSYQLADQRVRLLRGKLTLRQVTRRSDNGHQTPILTSRTDLSDVEVAFRMFERWRQENFFKYLREEYALDALADHRAEEADPWREVPNPRRKALDAELEALRAEIRNLAAQCGFQELSNLADLCRSVEALSQSQAPALRALYDALQRYRRLDARRAKVPRRVPVKQTVTGAVVRLAAEKKHLTNVLKMAAFHAETELVRLVAPHYARADEEGRTLIQSALASTADIEVTGSELRVRLAPLSSSHRSRAIAALCDELNRSPVRFPGSPLALRFAIDQPDSG